MIFFQPRRVLVLGSPFSSMSAPATRQVTFLPDMPWRQIGCQQSILKETLRKPALPG